MLFSTIQRVPDFYLSPYFYSITTLRSLHLLFCCLISFKVIVIPAVPPTVFAIDIIQSWLGFSWILGLWFVLNVILHTVLINFIFLCKFIIYWFQNQYLKNSDFHYVQLVYVCHVALNAWRHRGWWKRWNGPRRWN